MGNGEQATGEEIDDFSIKIDFIFYLLDMSI
jgi:hypothetical protein